MMQRLPMRLEWYHILTQAHSNHAVQAPCSPMNSLLTALPCRELNNELEKEGEGLVANRGFITNTQGDKRLHVSACLEVAWC